MSNNTATEKVRASAEMPPIPDEGFTPNISSSTLGEWGAQLPIGFLRDGVFHRNIRFKPYTMAAERELAKQRAKQSKKAQNAVSHTTSVLAHMIAEVGPYSDFQDLSHNQRLMILNQLYMGDIMYAYILLRIEALGEDLSVEVQCPSCGSDNKLGSDLNDLDITIPEDPYSLVRRYKLRNQVKTPKGELIDKLLLQPPRWLTMSTMKVGRNMDFFRIKSDLVTAATFGEDGQPLSKTLLDQLTKRDFELLLKEVDDNTPGPDLQLEVECPECGHESATSLRWDFDHFFGASSL